MADFLDLLRRVVDQQRVGALIVGHAAARREETTARRCSTTAPGCTSAALHALLRQQLGDVGCLAVADRYVRRYQLGLLLRLQACRGEVFLVLGDLPLWRDPDDVAVLALVQALGTQDDIQGLVPRHIDQADGDAAADAVRGHDVQTRNLCEQVQGRAHRNVLEIEGHALAGVDRSLARKTLLGLLDLLRRDVDHVLVVGLVGRGLDAALDLHDHRAATRRRRGGDALDRRGEVAHVQGIGKFLRNDDMVELERHLTGAVLQVHVGPGTAEVDEDLAATIRAAAEIDLGDLGRVGRGFDLGRVGMGGRDLALAGAVVHGQDQVVAVRAGVIGRGPEQLDHQASASTGRNNRISGSCARSDIEMTLGQSVGGVVQVHGDARRRAGGEDPRFRRYPVELQFQLHPATRKGLVADALERVGSQCGPGKAQRQQRQQHQDSVAEGTHGPASTMRVCGHHVRHPRWVFIARRARCSPCVPSSRRSRWAPVRQGRCDPRQCR